MTDPDQPLLFARHLLVCRTMKYDLNEPDSPYTLSGIVTTFRPSDDGGYPVLVEDLYVYAQFWGDPGVHDLWIDLTRVDVETGDETEVTTFGPFVLRVTAGRFVETRAWRLRYVPFPRAGLYEFQVRAAGYPDPLVDERISAED